MNYSLIGIIAICLTLLAFFAWILTEWKKTLEKKNGRVFGLRQEISDLEHYKEILQRDRDELIENVRVLSLEVQKSVEQMERDSKIIEESRQSQTAALKRELDQYHLDNKAHIEQILEMYKVEAKKRYDEYQEELDKDANLLQEAANQMAAETNSRILDLQEKYKSVIEPLRKLEEEENSLLHYTIWIPEQDRTDIEFLLNDVVKHLNHPDILYKLIWSEFVQKPMNEMFKRAGIDEGPGIYKITHIKNKKCYIGKSTNVRKRLQDHMKSTLGISSIADQRVHHVMLEEGIWNFMFEKIDSCDKDKLSEKEKYYIEFFNSTNWGYNVSNGG